MKNLLTLAVIAGLLLSAAEPAEATEPAVESPLAPMPLAPLVPVTRAYPGASPCNTSLQACINGSNEGDTILIAPGVYITSTVNVNKAVSLVGNGAAPTDVKLRPNVSARMLNYTNVPLTATIVISNLTIENGNAVSLNGGGIRVQTGNAPLVHTVVMSNNVAIQNGGAFRVDTPGLPVTVVNSIFLSNTAGNIGGGISVAGSLTLINTRVERNTAALNGGGVHATGQVTITGSTIQTNTTGNNVNGLGGGLTTGAGGLISATRIVSNVAFGGGGIQTSGPLTLIDTLVSRNTARSDGGGLYTIQAVTITLLSSSTQTRTEIANNTAITHGGGIYAPASLLLPGPNTSLISNMAAAGDGGGGWAAAVSDAPAALAVPGLLGLQSNVAGGFGGGLRAERDVALVTALLASGNTAGLDGGGLFAVGAITLTAATFVTNSARDGGGVAAVGAVSVTSSTFLTNAAAMGGGIQAQTALIASSYFTANRSFVMGAAAIQADRAVITASRFYANRGTDVGLLSTGGVLAGELSAENSVFQGNGGVGAAATISRTGAISNSSFTANCSGAPVLCYGSAVVVKSSAGAAPVTVYSSTFQNNGRFGGGLYGGAIYSEAQLLMISASRFRSNTAELAGAVYAASSLSVTDSDFTGNNASGSGISNGGALVAGRVDITRSTFYTNAAGTQGGAISAVSVNITDARFVANTVPAGGLGGAIAVATASSATSAIRGSIFENNRVFATTTGSGGAIFYASFGALTVRDSSFTGNQAPDAGAIDCFRVCDIGTTSFAGNRAVKPNGFTLANDGEGGAIKAGAGITVTRSRFVRNEAGAAGGAIASRGTNLPFGALTVQNSLFADNRATNPFVGAAGHAVFVSGLLPASTFFFNTVVSDSHVSGSALAILSGTLSAQNNIFRNHGVAIEHGPGGSVIEDFNLFSANTQNLSGTIASGGASITGTPLFVSPALDLYQLLPCSPGIDQGISAGVTEDYDGQARPQGAGFDIGYDEGGLPRIFVPNTMRGAAGNW